MLTSEAHVHSERPSRYISQLCRHAEQIQRLRNRGRLLHEGGDGQAPPEMTHVEWSHATGRVSFGWGRCVMEASATTLTLRAEATDEANLQWIQDTIAKDVERFGRREHLKVDWRRREAPGVGRRPTGSLDAPRPQKAAPATVTKRADGRTMALASAGALGVVIAVLVHLGLAGAVLATRWQGVTAIGLVVVIVTAVLGHAAIPVAAVGLRRRARRRKASAATEER